MDRAERDPDRVTIRASSTTSYLDCQLRGAAHSMPRLFAEHGHDLRRLAANVGALVGSGVHAGAEVALREKMTAETVAPVSLMEDAGIAELRRRRVGEGADGVILDGASPSLDAAEAQVRRMVGRYREDVVRHARPVSVESRIVRAFDDLVDLSGQGDLLQLDEREGAPGADVVERRGPDLLLRDLKTGARNKGPAGHMAQQGSYSLLYRADGFEVGAAQIDFLPRVRAAAAQPAVQGQPFDVAAAEQVAHAVLVDFAAKARAFKADGDPGRFIVNPHSYLCGPKYCKAWGTTACPATRGMTS